MSVETTAGDLYKQAIDQIDLPAATQSLEVEADVISATLQSLIADVQAYGGSGKITLSTATQNGLAVLQQIAVDSSVSAADITTPATSKPIQGLLMLKASIRTLQTAYYSLKAKLGLS